jgi:O-acetylhomoserine (thiol)-lyase
MDMTKHSFGFETRMIHAGHTPDSETGSRSVPIYQTTSYVFDSAEQAAARFDLKEGGYVYTRMSNPTTSVLEERLASLEGGIGAVATSSGMAAQYLTFLTLLDKGDEIVASSHLYGGTVTQLSHTLAKLSITVKFVDPTNLDEWKKAITPKTRMLYGETIGNPKGSVLDLEKLAALAHSHGIPLVIDNTFATAWLCRPFDFGADIVVYSATKFISGHGNSLVGAVIDSGKFDFKNFATIAAPDPAYHNLRFIDSFGKNAFLTKLRMVSLRDVGSCVSPFNAFLSIQGVETLSLRMERHVSNALAVAKFLEGHKKVAWVAYSSLPSHPQYALAKKYLPRGAGAVFSFGIKADPDKARAEGAKFIDALDVFSHLANIGDVRSLVIHPASTTHQQLSNAELEACGIGPELIRLSIGIENKDDLIWDLEKALAKVSA